MRLFGYLLIMILSYYAAGMYRSYPLLLLFVTEVLLLLLMRLLPFYLKKRLSLEFSEGSGVTERAAETVCRIRAVNRARLPVSRFKLRIQMRYAQGGSRLVKRLYGGVGEGAESDMEFFIAAPYCGLVLLRLERVSVYDYLSLFSSGRRLKEEMRLAVFPPWRPLHIEWSLAKYRAEIYSGEHVFGRQGNDGQEILQLREYQAGDSVRLVHWNQSARTEKLWIKEYEAEEEIIPELLLVLSVDGRERLTLLHAFYELVSALTAGILKLVPAVCVYWRKEESENLAGLQMIRGQEDLRELLLRFYHMDFNGPVRRKETSPQEEGKLFVFNMKLELYYQNILIHRFSEKNFEREIADGVYVL